MTALTYSDLKDRVLRMVDNTGADIWSTTYVFDKLGEATEDYAMRMTPIFKTDITTSANTRIYTLSALARGIKSVEYPQGEDPPEYLDHRPYQHPDFWQEDGYYDFIDYIDDDTSEKHIYISEKPAADETIRVYWTGRYNITNPPGAEDSVPVPEAHHHIILLYVFWQLILHQLGQEMQAPSSTATVELLRQLSVNAERAEDAYLRAVSVAASQTVSAGPTATAWTLDKYDRIY